MIKKLLQRVKHLWINLTKTGNDLVDIFTKPKNSVLILLRDKDTNEVVRTIKGRNIVTGYVPGAGGTLVRLSGRDLLRRVIINPAIGAQSVSGRYVAKMILGSGTDQESINDTGLDNSLYAETGAEQIIGTTIGTDIILDANDPDITFVCTWPAGVLDGKSIAEVGLYSNVANPNEDFLARKTFPAFIKTTNFTIEIQWTLRF